MKVWYNNSISKEKERWIFIRPRVTEVLEMKKEKKEKKNKITAGMQQYPGGQEAQMRKLMKQFTNPGKKKGKRRFGGMPFPM